jgi:hypothetical protein
MIYLDSQSAITLNENPKYHFWNKHVDTQYHFTWKFLENKSKSSNTLILVMTIYILTKALLRNKRYFCMKELSTCTLSKIISKLDALIFKVDVIPTIQGSIHDLIIHIKLNFLRNSCKYCGFNHYSPCDSLFYP